jgi:hypothetical protein
LISLLDRIRGRVGETADSHPAILAYPYDAARTMGVLLHAEAGYAFEQGLRKTLRLLRRRD